MDLIFLGLPCVFDGCLFWQMLLFRNVSRGISAPAPHRLTCDAARAGGTAQKARALSPCPRAECVSLSVRQGVSVRNYKDDKAVFTIPYGYPLTCSDVTFAQRSGCHPFCRASWLCFLSAAVLHFARYRANAEESGYHPRQRNQHIPKP